MTTANRSWLVPWWRSTKLKFSPPTVVTHTSALPPRENVAGWVFGPKTISIPTSCSHRKKLANSQRIIAEQANGPLTDHRSLPAMLPRASATSSRRNIQWYWENFRRFYQFNHKIQFELSKTLQIVNVKMHLPKSHFRHNLISQV